MDVKAKKIKIEKVQPYNKREDMIEKTSVKATSKSVKPVAKDTNKTRRKIVKPGILKTIRK